MRLEREVKIKLIDVERSEAINALKSSGCIALGDVIHNDYYFMHPCIDMLSLDEAIRVREEVSIHTGETKYFITYKGRRLSRAFKERLEVEVEVSGKEIIEILKALGFKVITIIPKERSLFKCSNTLVTVDYLSNLGLFMEVEGEKELIEDFLKNLKIRYEVVEKTYFELLQPT
ncbi:MAG: class IV adenylate cyclase [Sulfolobales archaeon]|nr:class IV adenylate cyclase [Sulfolobales archaeon]MCX8199198.1 class IV adenylate cyclase [Sulfolobales archaeon]MDW8170178.1 class IV adenylate cyclase [Desulfurococcaceae archaeon]